MALSAGLTADVQGVVDRLRALWLRATGCDGDSTGCAVPGILFFPFAENAGSLMRSIERLEAIDAAFIAFLSYAGVLTNLRAEICDDNVDVLCWLLGEAGKTERVLPRRDGVRDNDLWLNDLAALLTVLEGLGDALFCCDNLLDEYTLTYTSETWHVADNRMFFTNPGPPAGPVFRRAGSGYWCQYHLADTPRERCFDKLEPDRDACMTACDGGTNYTLKRDTCHTRWEVWEGHPSFPSLLLGWNDDPTDPTSGTWTKNDTVGGYAGTYTDNDAVPCGYSDGTCGIKVLTLGVS